MLHDWFKNHPDAKLLTDKINDPKAVSQVFTSKHQLMMKVHSTPALKTAKSLDLEFVMHENVLNALKTNPLQKLLDYKTKHILISRKSIAAKKELLLKLKEAEIKTYASHVNFEKGKDELFMYNNEMGFIYGFCADVWDFKN